jgi:hypothetical protein
MMETQDRDDPLLCPPNPRWRMMETLSVWCACFLRMFVWIRYLFLFAPVLLLPQRHGKSNHNNLHPSQLGRTSRSPRSPSRRPAELLEVEEIQK